jgi:hypothetical protein
MILATDVNLLRGLVNGGRDKKDNLVASRVKFQVKHSLGKKCYRVEPMFLGYVSLILFYDREGNI